VALLLKNNEEEAQIVNEGLLTALASTARVLAKPPTVDARASTRRRRIWPPDSVDLEGIPNASALRQRRQKCPDAPSSIKG